MKKGKILLSFLLLTSIPVAGCANKTLTGKVGTLKISIFEGGGGNTWAHKVVEAYKKYNPQADIVVNFDPLVRDEAVNACDTNSSDSDIFFIDGVNVPKYVETQHSIADITEVFSLKPKAGEKEEDITIADKIKPEILQEMKYNGDNVEYQNHYYTIPFASGPCSLIINVDAMNNTLGEGNWTEPKTSGELIALCDKIVAANAKIKIGGANYTIYPFIYSEAVEYWRYMYNVWIAQYEGFDKWGTYTDLKIDGKYDMEAFFPEGKTKALQEFERIIKRANGYCDPTSLGNKFMASQKYFIQGRACMYVCGDWLEREMEQSTSYSSNMRMIRVPVLSAMSEKIENTYGVSLGNDVQSKDKKLADIVTAIDDGKTSFDGLSDEVFALLKEIRGYTYTLGNASYGFIPECSVNKDMAFDFLRFLYTDEAIQIIYEDTKTLMPVKDTSKYQLDQSVIAEFRKSVLAISNDPKTKLIFFSNRSPIRYRAGLGESVNNEKVEVALGKKTGAMTAEEYISKDRNILKSRWDELLKYV